MITKRVQVTHIIDVTMDERKFDQRFTEEFNRSIFFAIDLDDHAEHLAQLYARGVIDGRASEFIEGYGPARSMGIEFKEVEQYQEVIETKAAA